MKLTQLIPNVYLAKFENQYELTSTFMRIQEFYESPFENIKDKNFSYENFFDAYVKQGQLTYWKDWVGFNVPSEALLYFYMTFQLNKRETTLYAELAKQKLNCENKFYLIGIYRNQDLSHELAHAFYSIYDGYKKEAQQLVANLPKKEFNKRCQELATSLYAPEMFIDEIQAYGVSNKERAFLALYKKYRRK